MNNPLMNLEIDPARGIGEASASVTIPGMLMGQTGVGAGGGADANKYRIRYQKLDIDSLGDISELEKLETMAIHNRGIFILSRERFAMQALGKVFILVHYMEEIPGSEKPAPNRDFVSSLTP